MHDAEKIAAGLKVAFGRGPALRLVRCAAKPAPKRRIRSDSEEFPHATQHAFDILDHVNLSPHPDLVEMLAAMILGDREHDRDVIASKIEEIAETKRVFTAAELCWIAYYVREAPRDIDGGFDLDVRERP